MKAQTLPALVEAAYELFASYTIGRRLAVCTACCVTDAEVAELVSTPLRQVSRRLLQNAYYDSARNYSAQELWEMKHFLPRVLDLVSGFEFPAHSTEITFTRLDLDQPEKWAVAELDLLRRFAAAYLAQYLDIYPLPSHEALSDVLVMFGIAHFHLPDLLAQWSAASSEASLLHLKDLLLHESGYAKNGAFALTNVFATPPVNAAFAAWLQNEQVKQAFSVRLEDRVLAPQGLTDETIAELSLTYDILRTL